MTSKGRKSAKRSSKKWIKGAVKKPGSFTAQAHRAGFQNVQAYAEWVLKPANRKKTIKRTKQRARLSLVFRRISKRRSKK